MPFRGGDAKGPAQDRDSLPGIGLEQGMLLQPVEPLLQFRLPPRQTHQGGGIAQVVQDRPRMWGLAKASNGV